MSDMPPNYEPAGDKFSQPNPNQGQQQYEYDTSPPYPQAPNQGYAVGGNAPPPVNYGAAGGPPPYTQYPPHPQGYGPPPVQTQQPTVVNQTIISKEKTFSFIVLV